MSCFLRNRLLLFNLLHQAVKVLIHLILVVHLVLALGLFKGLDIGNDLDAEPLIVVSLLLLALLLGLDLAVKVSLGLHLLLLPVFSLLLLSLGLLLILLSLVVLDSVQVLLELSISGNAASDSLLDVEALSRQVHLLLDKLDAALVDFTKFTGLVVLLLKD